MTTPTVNTQQSHSPRDKKEIVTESGTTNVSNVKPKVSGFIKVCPDMTVITDASISHFSEITTDIIDDEKSISGMSLVLSPDGLLDEDTTSLAGFSTAGDAAHDSKNSTRSSSPRGARADIDDLSVVTPINAGSSAPVRRNSLMSPARVRKRLIEQYAMSRSSSNLSHSSLGVSSLLLLEENTNGSSSPNLPTLADKETKPKTRRSSATVLRYNVKLNGIGLPSEDELSSSTPTKSSQQEENPTSPSSIATEESTSSDASTETETRALEVEDTESRDIESLLSTKPVKTSGKRTQKSNGWYGSKLLSLLVIALLGVCFLSYSNSSVDFKTSLGFEPDVQETKDGRFQTKANAAFRKPTNIDEDEDDLGADRARRVNLLSSSWV